MILLMCKFTFFFSFLTQIFQQGRSENGQGKKKKIWILISTTVLSLQSFLMHMRQKKSKKELHKSIILTLLVKKILFSSVSFLAGTQELQVKFTGPSSKPSMTILFKNISLWCSFSTNIAPIVPKPGYNSKSHSYSVASPSRFALCA